MEAQARATDQILSAAVRIFGERDPQLVTIEDVAKAAGLSKGLIVYHFGSFESLQNVLRDYLVFRLRQIWTPESPAPPKDQLRQWASIMQAEPEIFRLYLNLSIRSGKSAVSSFEALEAFRRDLLQECCNYFHQAGATSPGQSASLFCDWWEGASLRSLALEEREQGLIEQGTHFLELLLR
ncbi:MAG: TetR/AcrR family transcriptional regulator [Bacteroidia bacterium]|nr:TetR/AcrR family transcriptional regulator [Bacteroidia bacterium]